MLPISLAMTASMVIAQGPVPTPPVTRKGDLVEEKFGIKIADPYRWLEDADSAETKAWVSAQNAVTGTYLRSIPGWDQIRGRLEDLITYERFGVPEIVGNHLAYTRNSGTQNQSVYYISDLDGKNARVLLDPNTLSTDGTVAVNGTSFSPNGKYLAYSLSTGGSDWQEWRVREVSTGKDLPDVVKWSKFSGASWSSSSDGFYYSAFDAPTDGRLLQAANYFQKVYFHRLGTDPKTDRLVHQEPEHKEWGFGAEATEDGRYLLISQSEGTRPENRIFLKDLRKPENGVRPVLDKFDASYSYLGNDGDKFYFLTDKAAAKRRVIAVDVAKPDESHWKTIVPESEETLESASLIGDTVFASYLKDAHAVVRRFSLTGKAGPMVDLPGLGSVGGFGGRRHNQSTYFSYVGFTTPATIYRLGVKDGKVSEFRRPALKFDASQFETTQVFYLPRTARRCPCS